MCGYDDIGRETKVHKTSSSDIQILKEKIHKNDDNKSFPKYLVCKFGIKKEK